MTKGTAHDTHPAADLPALPDERHDGRRHAGEPPVLQPLRTDDSDPGTVWDLVLRLTQELSAARTGADAVVEQLADLALDRSFKLHAAQQMVTAHLRTIATLERRLAARCGYDTGLTADACTEEEL